MFKKLITIALVVLVSNCVWSQDAKSEKNEMIPGDMQLLVPEAGYGMVYVVRPVEAQPQMRFYVYLDQTNKDNLIGHTIGGKHIYFQVTPGEHTIYSTGKNTKSIKINIKAGDTLFIKQTVKMDVIGGSNQDNLEMVPPDAGKMLVERTVKGFLYGQEN